MAQPLRFRRIAIAASMLVWLGLGVAPASQATVYRLPPEGVDIVGQVVEIKTRREDTLADVAREFGVGHNEISNANPNVDKWVPGEGTRVLIPSRHILPNAPREGVVVNLPEMRLYYYPKLRTGEQPVVITYPISVGAGGLKTRMHGLWTSPTC